MDAYGFYLTQFAPKYRIARARKEIGNWKHATRDEFEHISEILAMTQLKADAKVSISEGGYFYQKSDGEFIEVYEGGNDAQYWLYYNQNIVASEEKKPPTKQFLKRGAG